MPDDLYHRDFLAWSEVQAERLRRLAAGERVNDLDWANLIEEMEGLGRSEVGSVRALLRHALLHAMKAAAWPGHTASSQWGGEIRTFLIDARDGYTLCMAQRIDVGELHADALEAVRDLKMGQDPLPLRDTTDLSLAELLSREFSTDALIARLRAE